MKYIIHLSRKMFANAAIEVNAATWAEASEIAITKALTDRTID